MGERGRFRCVLVKCACGAWIGLVWFGLVFRETALEAFYMLWRERDGE